ncbi:MAG TPA: DUF2357 domain-containing protein [Thermoanaerobaculia bacterium]|jgi:hypothetical protein|nr:DUF2357 domain-containing protein [Thermoanaerobaculia bacterium]
MPILLRALAEGWSLEVVGRAKELPPPFQGKSWTQVSVSGLAQVLALNVETFSLEVVNEALFPPVFFENSDYDFYLRFMGAPPRLTSPPGLTLKYQTEGLMHYALNFRNDVGFSDIKIAYDSLEVCINIEVFPLKVDYRTDYLQMREEVSDICRNLALSFLTKTFFKGKPVPANAATLAEWVALIRNAFQNLRTTGEAIAAKPHSRIRRATTDRPPDRARRVDSKQMVKNMRQSPSQKNLLFSEKLEMLPRLVPEVTTRITFDTPENRFFKATLSTIRRNLLELLHRQEASLDDGSPTTEDLVLQNLSSEFRAMLRDIQRLLAAPFLRQVPATSKLVPNSLVMHHNPRYAAFSKYARIVNGGVALVGDPVKIGVKNVALLYEYWCFIRLVNLLAQRFNLVQQNLIRISHSRVTVSLTKGRESTIEFLDKSSEKILRLTYNRRFSQLPTLQQVPDNVIRLASDYEILVFDAKYRLSFQEDYQHTFSGIGPTVEDIEAMHRYKDAIVALSEGGHNFVKGIVKAAIVLFPSSDEETYRHQRFYKSIASVQVGGLPFLPRATTLVEEVLLAFLREYQFLEEPAKHPL